MKKRNKKTGRIEATHGMTETPVWNSWRGMMNRCYCGSAANYHRYGGRGINVDPRWHDFETFYADVGDRPEGKTLDRPKNDEPYGPNNWRWATATEQQRNTRLCRRLKLNHRSLSISEWSEMLGIPPTTIQRRVDVLGWSVRKALTTPVQKSRKYQLIQFDGRQMTIAQWSRELGIPHYTIRSRLYDLGWSPEKALTTEVRACRRP